MGKRSCEVGSCQGTYYGQGFCEKHYKRWRRWGDPNGTKPTRLCEFDGCLNKHEARGYCKVHYNQLREGKILQAIGIRRVSHTGRDLIDRELCPRPGCSGEQRSGGYCGRHYKRMWSLEQSGAVGVTWDMFDSLFEKQGGVCAVCSTPLDVDSVDTHVDHCHATGAVRGLLCRHCNTGLGHFKDRPDILISAASYLERATM